jgi:hypothetical protein
LRQRWLSGDVVALREIWNGRVWKARPWIVVEDGPDRLVLWIPKGAQTMVPEGRPAVPSNDWELAEGRFGTNALRVTKPGSAHSILHFFEEGGEFRTWYVNLERPLMRTSVGFDLSDLFLDLLVEPDGTHRWLDEDELEQALAGGLITEAEAAEARAAGERVLAAWPFPTGWESWRPNPSWRVPELPSGWERVS